MEVLAIGNALNRQTALTRELHRASNLYYGGNPIMSDLEFDTKLATLAAQERASFTRVRKLSLVKLNGQKQKRRKNERRIDRI